MSNEQIAIFAGGCFWCTVPVFSQLKGVSKVESGYIGGHTTNPTYKAICNGDTGHAEGIRISFDADAVSFETLLEVFLVSHDPTTPNRQGNDVGTQYRSAVFCQSQAQRDAVAKMIADKALDAFSLPADLLTALGNLLSNPGIIIAIGGVGSLVLLNDK